MWIADIQDTCILGLDYLEHQIVLLMSSRVLRWWDSLNIPMKKSSHNVPPIPTVVLHLLTVVDSIQHFHPYLHGQRLIVRTYCSALKRLFNFKHPEGQVARWPEILQG
jgi:hypothetical protein